jgi:hypothetical protein
MDLVFAIWLRTYLTNVMLGFAQVAAMATRRITTQSDGAAGVPIEDYVRLVELLEGFFCGPSLVLWVGLVSPFATPQNSKDQREKQPTNKSTCQPRSIT